MSIARNTLLSVRVAKVSQAAKDVVTLELQSLGGVELPAFSAGSHIDLHLANGQQRSYSLLNSQHERHRYVLAVQKNINSRGGSVFIHEKLSEGMMLDISSPSNNFELNENANSTELIAGGIGITPIFSMVQRLEALGRSWHLNYCVRTREHASFFDELRCYGDKVNFNFDHEPGGKMLDLGTIVTTAQPGTHFYCCGPLPMLTAFEAAVVGVPDSFVHLEHFSAAPSSTVSSEGHSYTVSLAKSGVQFEVVPGETILDKLIELNFDVAYSCREGVCGSCETAVLAGIPNHHDLVLTKAEKAASKTMMVCCSSCLGDKLVLDL
jgi:ferredoxin-NADP reductase